MLLRWFKPKGFGRLKLQIGTTKKGKTIWENIPIEFELESEREPFLKERPMLREVQPEKFTAVKSVSKLPKIEKI